MISLLLLLRLQYLVSFGVFFYPGARRPVRTQLSPFHIGLGVAIIGLAHFTAGTSRELTIVAHLRYDLCLTLMLGEPVACHDLLLALLLLLAATGVLEKLSFNGSCNVAGILNGAPVSGFMAPDCVLGNSIGLLLALSFAAFVVTIVHNRHTSQPLLEGDESSPLISDDSKHA